MKKDKYLEEPITIMFNYITPNKLAMNAPGQPRGKWRG